jgi:hypothetical protein
MNEKLIRCSKCNVEKNKSEFFKDKQKKSGHRPDCKICNMAKCNEWAHKNRNKRKYYILKCATGLTKEQYNRLLHLQDNKCHICKRGLSELTKNLSVDHCHVTNNVRGLLCYKCNVGIGFFNDDINLLHSAISYLESNLSSENIKYKQQ